MNIKQEPEQKQESKIRLEHTQAGLYDIRIDCDRYEPRMDDNYHLHFDGGKIRKRPPCDWAYIRKYITFSHGLAKVLPVGSIYPNTRERFVRLVTGREY